MDKRLIDFLNRLERAGSVEGAWSDTVAFFSAMGHSVVHSWYGTPPGEVRILSNTPDWWVGHYMEKEFWRHDHVYEYCTEHYVPTVTGLDVPEAASIHPVSRQMMQDTNEGFGLRNALIVPVHGFTQRLEGGFNLGTTATLDKFSKQLNADDHLLYGAALSAHARIQQLLRAETLATVRLTEREREVLLWLAKGLRTTQIAHQLNLKEVTVNLHVVKAKRKLNAASREQAVAKAILAGVIEP